MSGTDSKAGGKDYLLLFMQGKSTLKSGPKRFCRAVIVRCVTHFKTERRILKISMASAGVRSLGPWRSRQSRTKWKRPGRSGRPGITPRAYARFHLRLALAQHKKRRIREACSWPRRKRQHRNHASNDPRTKSKLTIVLRSSERSGCRQPLTRATRRKKEAIAAHGMKVREEKSRLELMCSTWK